MRNKPSFVNDYSEGAHETILARLLATNLEKTPGYGQDCYTESAKARIREACACPEADVAFLVGGTQTNQTALASLLKPYEGVLAADSGHVNVHEAGAIEATGHKVITLPSHEGKIAAADLRQWLETFYADETHEHMVFPGLVYISWPTEFGTLYSLAELQALRQVCDDYDLPLYADGARLGYGLAAAESEAARTQGPAVRLADLAKILDVFYIGGTKVGALFGEALVFPRHNAPAHLMTLIKRQGALLAKGRLLALQFDCLFTDELYLRISRQAVERADDIRRILKQKGYRLWQENPTNQVFVILSHERRAELAEQVNFDFWEKYDETQTIVRFATSWATTEADVAALAAIL